MDKVNIYVASSWRNDFQQMVVRDLREAGYGVYDFKHPKEGEPGFQWSKIDENWQDWTREQYCEGLRDDYARFGFNRDFDAMKQADVCVLVLPCGRSAHLEAGWMKGAGKKVIAYIPPLVRIEPELMYGLLDGVALNGGELCQMLSVYEESLEKKRNKGIFWRSSKKSPGTKRFVGAYIKKGRSEDKLTFAVERYFREGVRPCEVHGEGADELCVGWTDYETLITGITKGMVKEAKAGAWSWWREEKGGKQ